MRVPNKKSRIQTYTDGIVKIVMSAESAVQSSFGAPVTPETEDDLVSIVSLPFARMSQRQRDVEFATAIDKSLDLKICTPFHPEANTSHLAVIDGVLYDIYQAEPDVTCRITYIYLQEVRRLGSS